LTGSYQEIDGIGPLKIFQQTLMEVMMGLNRCLSGWAWCWRLGG
jgi:hypothetical protein